MIMFLTCFLLVLSTCVSWCQCSEHSEAHIYYIEPAEGKRCQNASPCLNITAFGNMADNFSNSSDMVVYFLEGTHLLNLSKLVVFRNLHNATFVGRGRMEQGFHETVWQSTVVITCTKSSGIVFVNGSNITFKFITITNCGDNKNLPFSYAIQFGGALIFFRVANITVNYTSVQNGSMSGLVIVADGFYITIFSSSFSRNNAIGDFGMGGNLLLFYTDPLEYSFGSKVYISRSNVSFSVCNKIYCVGAFGAGGLIIHLNHTSYLLDILLDSIVAYNNNPSNIQLFLIPNVHHCNLTINKAISSYNAGFCAGGGLFIGSVCPGMNCGSLAGKPIGLNNCIILNSKFTDNSAVLGGGIDIDAALIVTMESTEISNNVGWVGTGLAFSHTNPCVESETQWNITFTNVTINSNYQSDRYAEKFRQLNTTVPSAVSLVTLSRVLMKLNNVSITNNNSTGLVAYNATILMSNSSESIFHNNSGVNGGGMAMYKDSYLLFEEGACLLFTDNSATENGGAIFAEEDFLSLNFCFFQYVDQFLDPNRLLSARVYLSGNSATQAGSAVFGGNIDSCRDISTCVIREPGTIYYTFNSFFNFSDQGGHSVVSSTPFQVCFCEDGTPNCSLKTLNRSAYPGEKINISVVTVGQRNGVVPGTIQLRDHQKTTATDPQMYNTLAQHCKDIPIEIKIQNANTKMLVYSVVVVDCQNKKYCPLYNKKWLDVTVQGCPPGFQLSSDTQTCDCNELKGKVPDITCDATTQKLSGRGNLWITFNNISHCFVKHDCPPDYCDSSTKASFTLTDPESQCAPNRTGTLCGSCRDGFSLSLGSNNCKNCSSESSYISLILPFAAAGFGLVVLLMVLNLTVSAGTINGLIFYANVFRLNNTRSYDSIPVLSLFISWLNLDLGIETCFFSGMTAYIKVWLQFVFPLYIWFIIATLIVLCRYSTWLSNKIGGNVVQVLATLILLSYTKLFRNIVFAFKSASLSCASANETRVMSLVWYMDGTIDYFSWQHVLLLVVALVFLLLAVPYTLALLIDTLIEKYLTQVRLFRKWWVKLKPLIDAYRGPYKDSCRFWTGLLLFARMVFVSLALFDIERKNILVFIIMTTVLLLSLIGTFRGIYQKRHLDILECWSLLNLVLLSSLAATQQEDVGVKISVSLMLATFIGVLTYHVFLRLQDVSCIKKLAKNKHRRNSSDETERLLQHDDVVIERAMVVPTTSDVCLRRETLIY